LYFSSLRPVGCLPASIPLFIYLSIYLLCIDRWMIYVERNKRRGKCLQIIKTCERKGKFIQNFSQETRK
jgi:hypothetical protein